MRRLLILLAALAILAGCGSFARRLRATSSYRSASATSAQAGVASRGGGVTCNLTATTSNFTSQVSAATPGQTICLASGNYGTWSGTSKSAPGITITAAPGAAVTLAFVLSTGVKDFTIDGTEDGGTISDSTQSEMDLYNSTTPVNITIKNMAFTTELEIDGPTNSNILLDHDSWTNVGCHSIGSAARLHLIYGTRTTDPSGVTVEYSSFVGGSAQGIQMGLAMNIIDNYFANIYEGADTDCHTDPILPECGSSPCNSPTATPSVIKGNLFYDNADGITDFDGGGHLDIENNVIDTTTETAGIDLGSDQASSVIHNTLINISPRAAGIDRSEERGQTPSTGTIIRDNIVQSRGGTPIALTGGGCNCTATPAENTNNMLSTGATSPNFNG